MKNICKNKNEPDSFCRWKSRNKSGDWSQFSLTSEYKKLKLILIEEQLKMCCYCEEIISQNNSHIEHLKPKGIPIYRKEMFLYKNIMASCNKKESCGIKKQKWYNPEMVSPLDKNCNERFTYTDDGRIIPSELKDKWALKTIEKLGLNSPKLKALRQRILWTLVNSGENDDLQYLKTLINNTLKGKPQWTNGFYTILLFIEEKYSIRKSNHDSRQTC